MTFKVNKLALAITALVSSAVLSSCGGSDGGNPSSNLSAAPSTKITSNQDKNQAFDTQHLNGGDNASVTNQNSGSNLPGTIKKFENNNGAKTNSETNTTAQLNNGVTTGIVSNGKINITIDQPVKVIDTNSNSGSVAGNSHPVSNSNISTNESNQSNPSSNQNPKSSSTDLTLPSTSEIAGAKTENKGSGSGSGSQTSAIDTSTNQGKDAGVQTSSAGEKDSSTASKPYNKEVSKSEANKPSTGSTSSSTSTSISGKGESLTKETSTETSGGSIAPPTISVSRPDIGELPDLSTVNTPVIKPKKPTTELTDSCNKEKSDCHSRTLKGPEEVTDDEVFETIDPYLISLLPRDLMDRTLPTVESFRIESRSKDFADAATDVNSKNPITQAVIRLTGYTGTDSKVDNSVTIFQPVDTTSWTTTTTSNSNLYLNNPSVIIGANDLTINGVGYLYRKDIANNANSGTSINELLHRRIETGSENIVSNYRVVSLKGLQTGLENSYFLGTRTRYQEYDLGSSSKFNQTYLGLTQLRHIRLDSYKPTSVYSTVASLNERTFETYAILLNGTGVKVGVIDTKVNDRHPLLEGRVRTYLDFDNVGKDRVVATKYKQIVGQDFPFYHGTEVALIIGSKSSPFVRDYQGIAPKVDIDAYEMILDHTNVAKVFSKAKANGNSIVNASFTFGRRDKDYNNGVLEELRNQALDWKNAPLYVFATGNRSNEDDVTDLTGLLSDIANDQTISPIALTVTGVSIDKEKLEAGKTGIDSLSISPLAVPCGVSAANCLSGMFAAKVSNPSFVTPYSINPINNQLTNDLGTRVYGTSFAAPQITGGAAVVKQMFPWMTANNLRQTILTTATDLGDKGVDDVYGWGLLNIGKAIGGPAAFAFGDYIVNIEKSNLNNNRLSNSNANWYFTNNIVGFGGLTYYNDTEHDLVFTGQNTYTGKTKVVKGRLQLVNSTSASPFEISALGAVEATNHSQINNDVFNTGFFNLDTSNVRGQVSNLGSFRLSNAYVDNNFVNGNNAILANNGVSSIRGNLKLNPYSVFLTDLGATLSVSGKATIDGAIGISVPSNRNIFVPSTAKVYKIIDAQSFDANKRRFNMVYSNYNELTLVDYDVLYDDNNADVYVRYVSRSPSELLNVRLGRNPLYNPSVKTLTNGGIVLSNIVNNANREYITHLKSNPYIGNDQIVDQGIVKPSASFEKSETLSHLQKLGSEREALPHRKGISEVRLEFGGFSSAGDNLEVATQDQCASQDITNQDKSNLTVDDIDTSFESVTLNVDTSNKDTTSDVLTSNIDQLDPNILATIELQSKTSDQLFGSYLAASASIFSDTLNTSRFVHDSSLDSFIDKVANLGNMQRSLLNLANAPDNRLDVTADYAHMSNDFTDGNNHIKGKFKGDFVAVGGVYSTKNVSHSLLLGKTSSSINEVYSEGEVVDQSFAKSNSSGFVLAYQYSRDLQWASLDVKYALNLDEHNAERSVIKQGDLTSKFSSLYNRLESKLRFNVLKNQATRIDVYGGLGLRSQHLSKFAETANYRSAIGLGFDTIGKSLVTTYGLLGSSLTSNFQLFNLDNQFSLNLGFMSQLGTKDWNIVSTNQTKSEGLYKVQYSAKVTAKYTVNVNSWTSINAGVSHQRTNGASFNQVNLGVSFKIK